MAEQVQGAEQVQAVRLSVYLTEDDRMEHRALSSVVLARARQQSLAGATVWRGIEGFSGSGRVRSNRSPDTEDAMPEVVEIIDTASRIEAFLPTVTEVAPGALVVLEPVTVVPRQVNPNPGGSPA